MQVRDLNDGVIPVFLPVFPSSEKIGFYIDEATRSGQFSNGGPLVTRLEERLAGHFNIPASRVAMCSSGTAALEGALATVSSAGSPVHLPSWTFTATPGSALRAGLQPTFVDVDESQRADFPADTSLAVDVLPFGARADWYRSGAPRQTVLVDAAASFDACRDFAFPEDRKVGVIVSLHATKALPVGEGGVFFSNDEAWVAEFRRWSNFGMWGSRVSQIPGTNAKMSELTAAVAHASLDAWPAQRLQWLELRQRAQEISSSMGLTAAGVESDLAAPYWNIQLEDQAARTRLESLLQVGGVETRRWWGDGCHTMPAYQDIPRGRLDRTEGYAATVLGLPFHLGLKSSDFNRIRTLLERFLDDGEL